MRAMPGMVVESEIPEMHELRRSALELLLSDHVGDCLSPCARICPLGLNIPQMLRQVQAGRLEEAATTVRSALGAARCPGSVVPSALRKRMPPLGLRQRCRDPRRGTFRGRHGTGSAGAPPPTVPPGNQAARGDRRSRSNGTGGGVRVGAERPWLRGLGSGAGPGRVPAPGGGCRPAGTRRSGDRRSGTSGGWGSSSRSGVVLGGDVLLAQLLEGIRRRPPGRGRGGGLRLGRVSGEP